MHTDTHRDTQIYTGTYTLIERKPGHTGRQVSRQAGRQAGRDASLFNRFIGYITVIFGQMPFSRVIPKSHQLHMGGGRVGCYIFSCSYVHESRRKGVCNYIFWVTVLVQLLLSHHLKEFPEGAVRRVALETSY